MIKIRRPETAVVRGISMPDSSDTVLQCVQNLVEAVCILQNKISVMEERIKDLETIGQTGGTRIK